MNGQSLPVFLIIGLVPPVLLFILLNLRKVKVRPYDMASVTQYGPPAGLGPAEMLFFTSQFLTSPGVGTLVDLAERGHIVIEDLPKEEQIMLSPFSNRHKRVRLWRVAHGEGGDDLRPYESDLIEHILSKGEGFLEVDPDFIAGKKTSIQVNGRSIEFVLNLQKVVAELRERGYIRRGGILNPAVLPRLAVLLLAVFGAWFYFNGGGAFGLAAFLSAFILTPHLGKFISLTKKGQAMVPQIAGFRRFVRSVYRHRVDWTMHHDEDEKLLGYAVAFGYGKRWHETLAKRSRKERRS